jgi:hypothetical protein
MPSISEDWGCARPVYDGVIVTVRDLSQSYPMATTHPAPAHGAAWIAPFLPWTDGTGHPWQGWRRLPIAAAFVLLYLAVSWLLFIRLAAHRQGHYAIDQEALRRFLYAIPDLTDEPLRVVTALLAAPFLNHNDVQIVYVTVLLLLFGIIFEVKEGSARAAPIFFGTTWLGALVAGVLVHLVYPNLIEHEVVEKAWHRTWSGGSAGAYGIMGAFAARARRPGPLLCLIVLWEINVAYWYLRHLTPAFHLTALVAGFAVTRSLLHVIRPARTDGPHGPRRSARRR